jgi:Tetratricopeptide repeat
MCNLAIVFDDLKKPVEAEKLWRDALKVQRRVLGRNHPDTLITMVQFGKHNLFQGNYNEAERLLRDALDGCRETLDRNHETTDAALALLSALYQVKKEPMKAVALAIEAQEITRRIWGADHALTAAGNLSVGSLLLAQGDTTTAEPYLRESWQHYVKAEAQHRNRFNAESLLAGCLVRQKRYAEAEPLLISAFHGIKAHYKSDPSGTRGQMLLVVEQIAALCRETDRLRNQAAFIEIRADLDFQRILSDLRFPAEPFAPH